MRKQPFLHAALHTPSDPALTAPYDDVAGWDIVDSNGNASLIWAANGGDNYVGYHGRGEEGLGGRGKLIVNWAEGAYAMPARSEVVMPHGAFAGVLIGVVIASGFLGVLLGLAWGSRAGSSSSSAETTTSASAKPVGVKKEKDVEGGRTADIALEEKGPAEAFPVGDKGSPSIEMSR